MIERYANTQLVQRLERLQLGRAFADDVAVADFELDTTRVDRRVFERIGDRVHEPLVHQLLR